MEAMLAELNEELGPVEPLWDFRGSFADIPAIPPPPSFCGDWLRAGSYTMLYARAGMGKSALCAHMIACMKDRKPWLDQTTADPGRVVWINGDMPMWQVSERLGYLGRFPDVELVNVDEKNLMMYPDEILAMAEGTGLLVFDNFSALFELDVMDPAAWKPFNILMKRVCATGCAVIVQQHEGKGASIGSFGSSAQGRVTTNDIRVSSRIFLKPEEGTIEGFNGEECLKVVWNKHRMSTKPKGMLFHLKMNRAGELVADHEPFIDDFGKRRIPLHGGKDH
jgi:hypothetical protein